MSANELSRVEDDLAAMRVALGFRLPFEWEHVWTNLALAVVGTVIAALTEWTDVSAVPSARGSVRHWTYIGLVLVPPLCVLGTLGLVAHRRKNTAPQSWRESRRAWPVAAVAAALYLGFTAWAFHRGASAGATTAATLFLAGLLPFASALVNKGLYHSLGWAVATILAGFAALSATYETAGLVVGGWLIAGGLASAAIAASQLRKRSEYEAH